MNAFCSSECRAYDHRSREKIALMFATTTAHYSQWIGAAGCVAAGDPIAID